MKTYLLRFTLQSDATFASGNSHGSTVDIEVAYDQYGFPYLDGRTIKGLLTEECDNLLEVLPSARKEDLYKARYSLFGKPGSRNSDQAKIHIDRAQLPLPVRQTLFHTDGVGAYEILQAFTNVRRQSAIDIETEAPEDKALRASRVIRKGTQFQAEIVAKRKLSVLEEALLVASVQSWRRAGTLRNRGRGELVATLVDTADGTIPDTEILFASKEAS